MRLGLEKELEKEEQIKTGYLICKTCLLSRELYLFNRQIKSNKTYYKNKKCKICATGKIPKVYKTTLEGKIREPKLLKIKSNITLSLDAKEFVKRVIYMRGYVDSVEAFKLVHYHIQTFGYSERIILDIGKELTMMFRELLEVLRNELLPTNC